MDITDYMQDVTGGSTGGGDSLFGFEGPARQVFSLGVGRAIV